VTRSRPVLVVDNGLTREGGRDFVAVCVASLEGVGRTTSLLGSEAAGAAVAEYAQRLSSMLRRDDQLIQIHEAKHCLLIHGLKDRNHAALAGMKLERLFEEPFGFRDVPVPLQVRAGIACGASGVADAESLFRAAEAARESARRSDKVYELADELVVADMRRRWQLNDELNEALFQHQLKLYYQPKVRADDHRLCGAEGLIRWEHPDGLLYPGDFLPHLERDKMLALTRHVIRQCVRDLVANPWLPPLSINLDPEAAEEPTLIRLMLDELTLWNVDPARLVIEMTENGIVQNVDRLREDFAELRSRGVKISMDDFGTGNSSLAQFRDLRVDEIKIDRSFVFDLEENAANRYLTGLIVELGHYFGMTVVAEGIETRQVAATLKDMRCDVLQGFHFSPPLPLAELSSWAEARKPPNDCA
jgi:EAL domain-containing protein (putative c-di-GMP-specific phosphodiesterase class I)